MNPKVKVKPVIGEEFTYVMIVDLDDLIDCGGINGLNELMDQDFIDVYGQDMILEDVSYKPVCVDNENNIQIEVCGLVVSTD